LVIKITCLTCREQLPSSSFSKTYKNGKLHLYCKTCRAIAAKKHRKNNPNVYRNYEYKKKYKIDLDTYNKVLDKQNGVCAICQGTWSKVLVVDHDHDCCPGEKTCGKCLRALLCGSCNAGLGWFKHNTKIMESAIKYMQEVKGQPWS
jgi:hypothetical protein